MAGLSLFAITFMWSCHANSRHVGNVGAGDSIANPTFLPVTAFLQEQVKKLEVLPVDPALFNTHNGKRDSGSIKTASIREMTAPFLAAGFGDPASQPLYKESTFTDSSHHRLVYSYEALGDSTALNKVDVYVDPGTNDIRQVYMQYITYTPDSSIRKQLIWETDRNFTLITSVDRHEYTADMRKQKVVWAKNP